ncbi:MAG: hypothetical protein R3D33_08930 [Hyphomicrobiaceae bacterium]
MTATKPTRGRPKGSGINDRAILLSIAGLIVDNPTLKRTTAIKQAGITNPSTIRRLRDKFAAEGDTLIAEVEASRAAVATATEQAVAAPAKSRRKSKAPVTTVETPAAEAAAIEEPIIQISATAAAAPAATAAPAPAAEDPNIEAIVMQVLGQVLGADMRALQSSPILALLKEQMKLIDTVLPIIRQQIAQVQRVTRAA